MHFKDYISSMQILNYIYFVILTFLLFYYVQQKRVITTHPLDKSQKLIFNGTGMFWVLLFSTGLLAFSAPMGLDLMSVRLFSLEILCLICLRITKNRCIWSFPLSIYVLFLLWLIIGLFYTTSISYGIRVILKYFYPIIVTLTASTVVRNETIFLKSSLGARKVAIVCLVVSFVPYIGLLFPGVFWCCTARAINFISISILSLALFFYAGRNIKDLMWCVIFMLPCVIWVLRTSIMGNLVALSVFSIFRYKIRALPILALIGAIGIGAVFFIPSVREKMFNSDDVTMADFREGRVSMGDVNSNARFAMWEFFENQFYKGHELQGSGTGVTQEYFYTHFIFGGLTAMHSDIVQMKCDNGLIALFLYYVTILLMIGHAFIVYCRSKRRLIKLCSITAGATLAGVAATMYSDNVVNYSMCTLAYPFGFYGIMLGLLKGVRREKHD